jgi:hypothetical protein
MECLRSGFSVVRKTALHFSILISSVYGCRIIGREISRTFVKQSIPAAAAGPLSLSTSTGSLKEEEQHETEAITGKMVAVRDTVELTEMEEKIFQILTATLDHFGLKTQLRVAGGWVRDKVSVCDNPKPVFSNLQ